MEKTKKKKHSSTHVQCSANETEKKHHQEEKVRNWRENKKSLYLLAALPLAIQLSSLFVTYSLSTGEGSSGTTGMDVFLVVPVTEAWLDRLVIPHLHAISPFLFCTTYSTDNTSSNYNLHGNIYSFNSCCPIDTHCNRKCLKKFKSYCVNMSI